jgi:hypothetical protein
MGKEGGAVFNACRIHSYDKLILVMEQDAVGGAEHMNIREFEETNPNPLEILPVDALDFFDCYKAVERVLNDHKKDEVILNISGGTKLLSMASILCAFNHGMPAYHYEVERLTRLPVLKNFSIKERISSGPQVQILLEVRDGITLKALEKRATSKGISSDKLERGLMALKNRDIIRTKLEKGRTKLFLTDHGKKYKDYFRSLKKRGKR